MGILGLHFEYYCLSCFVEGSIVGCHKDNKVNPVKQIKQKA